MCAFLILVASGILPLKIPNEIKARNIVNETVCPIDPIVHLELAKSATLDRSDIKEDEHK